MNINILKTRKRKRTKVSILKEVRMQRDFFSDPTELVSDGYEEKQLLYRIAREIHIEKILKRAHEKMTEKSE